MKMGTPSRAALVRTSSVAAVLLVAAATRADVAASSRTGNQPPDSKKGKDAVSAQSSSGKASATSQPSLSAVTEKTGNNDPNQNGSNASFSDRARVVNGAGKSVRLSFGFTGAVTCSSEPGKINSATASARGGEIGRGGSSQDQQRLYENDHQDSAHPR